MAVPVVYSPAAAHEAGPSVPREASTAPEANVPDRRGSAASGTTPEQGPVRDHGTAREPDAVWMPESARPVAGERDGVSEANLSRNENDEQVFVVWTPEESEGGGRR